MQISKRIVAVTLAVVASCWGASVMAAGGAWAGSLVPLAPSRMSTAAAVPVNVRG